MRGVTCCLLVLVFLTASPVAAQWYEPAPCYACAVDPSYGNQRNPYTEQTQRGWAPNFGLGYDNGTSFGGGAPQAEWQNEYSPSYDPNYSWEAPSQNYQPMIQEQPDNYSYGIPGYDKRLDSCGPYYNKRARAGC